MSNQDLSLKTRYDYLLHSTLPTSEDWGIREPPLLTGEAVSADHETLRERFEDVFEASLEDEERLPELKQLNRTLAQAEWEARASKLTSRPGVVQLSQTEVCNLLCTYCRPEKPKDLQTLPRDRCIPILHKILPAAHEFLPFCWGEPLVSPDFVEMCRLARDYQTPVSFITNLNYTTPPLIDAFSRYADRALVSIDSVNAEEFSRVRRRGSLEELESNLADLQKASEENGRGPWLGVSAVLTRSNMNGIPDLIRWASDHGFRGVVIRRVIVRELLPHFKDTKEIDLLSAEYLRLLDTSKKLTEDFGLVLNMPDPTRSQSAEPPCRCLWDHVYVSASGVMNMCVYSHRQPLAEFPVGKDFWNMPEVIHRREGWTDESRCEECCVLDFVERPEVTQIRGY